MPQRLTRRFALGTAAAVALASPALPQGLPGRPVTLIVPYSAGSPPDIVARLLAEGLARRTGGPHVVDNRTGASGNIGTAAVARAAPDGTTLLVQTNTLAMNASLFRSLPYDPVISFAPVAELATAGFGLLVHASIGTTAQALVARAKTSPGGLDYGSPGIGTPHHLAMELFRQQAGIELAHVPYRNLAGAVTDLLAGRVAAMFVSAGAAQGLAGESRVRLVAVASPARLPTFPDVPTLAEIGPPATDMSGWYGLFAPAGTPPAIVARLNAATNEVLASPEVAAALLGQGITPVGGAPDRLGELVAADATRWAEVVRAAGIVPE